ncbi:MAG: putative bifunctional diguanylate cyclase/phosphodiesterase, partial [Sphingobium sp.]
MPPIRNRIENDEEASGIPSILETLGLTEGNNEISPIWAAQSIRSVAILWPLFMLAKLSILLGSVSLPILFSSAADGTSAMLCLMAAMDIAIWQLPRLHAIKGLKPHRQMWLMCVLVLLSGLSTSLAFYWMPATSLSDLVSPLLAQSMLALLAICIFGHQRCLGLFYCAGIGLCAVGLRGPIQFLLFLAVLITIAISTVVQARFDRKRLIANQIEDGRSRRAHRLLTEYEESGRGWFWETDRSGALTYHSASLSRSLSVPVDQLLGRRLTELVVMGDALQDATDHDRTLGFHLSARSAFSEISVRAAVGNDERAWAISGRPIVNEYGQFLGFRGSGSDLTEMQRSQAEVARLARFDSLTGLANRIQMARHLEQSVTRPDGRSGDCALFLLDLDRFKSVNDTMGHPAGDALLKQVSQRLERVVADRGVVGRLGGDEFKVVLPGHPDRAKLGVLADAIIATLSQPYIIEGVQVVIGASVGIALCPDDGTNTDMLVRNADLALYAAKGDGRGVHRFYSPEMLADAEDRRKLEDDLRVALEEGALELHYQPVVSVKTDKITGFEALLRWNHPTRGAISPATFVPIAEDAGLIGPLGEWAMRTACATAATWPAGTRVAVNVSPIQFANPALPGIVMNALAASGLPPERLELEITESCFL